MKWHTRKKATMKQRVAGPARPRNTPPAMEPAATAEALSGASEAAMVDATESSVKGTLRSSSVETGLW